MKPSKEYFDVILEKLNLQKSEIIMVGDDLEKDILGATNLGIDAILYDPSNKYINYKGYKISNLKMVLNAEILGLK